MSESTDEAVRTDGDGWLRVDLSRRSVIGALGAGAAATIAASLGAGQSGGNEVGPPTTTVGGQATVPRAELDQTGTMQAVYVAFFPEQLPPNPPTPAFGVALEGGERIQPGSPPYAETGTVETNLAEIHVVDDPTTVSLNRSPALIVSKQAPGLQLAVDGTRHARSAVGGTAARVHGGQDQADLPGTLGGAETPAPGCSKANGTRVWL
jgi:hypothetical protein